MRGVRAKQLRRLASAIVAKDHIKTKVERKVGSPWRYVAGYRYIYQALKRAFRAGAIEL